MLLYREINLYFTVLAVVSMSLSFVFTPAHFKKHNIMFIKLGTNEVKMTSSWRYFFLRHNVFGYFSLKETEHLLHFGVR